MKKIKSLMETVEEVNKKINNHKDYSSHIAFFNCLCFAPGKTITIKKSFLNRFQIVCNQDNVLFYSRYKVDKDRKKDLKLIEKISGLPLQLRHDSEITFGGR